MSYIHEYGPSEPKSQEPEPALCEQSSTAFRFTWFRDQYGQRKRLIRLASPDKFANCLRATTAPTKEGLPWAKLAEFGPNRSPNDSYRHDANVIGLFGAECDYDGTDVPIEDAAALIQAAGIEAVLNETTTPGHWRIWLPARRFYTGPSARSRASEATVVLRMIRSSWVARANGELGGILAPESFVLSQAFYVGGIKGQPPIKVIVTEGARIDDCNDLDDGAIFKNGGSEPGERRQPSAVSGDETPNDPNHTDPRLLRECRLRVANFAKSCGYGRTPTGERCHRLVQWLADIGTRDGLTPSVSMIHDAIRFDYPNTSADMIRSMLSRRKVPRGCNVIDAPPELPWDVQDAIDAQETTND